jgi:hypothetical protein
MFCQDASASSGFLLPPALFPEKRQGTGTPPGYLGNGIQKATAVLAKPWQAFRAYIIYVSNLCQCHIWG